MNYALSDDEFLRTVHFRAVDFEDIDALGKTFGGKGGMTFARYFRCYLARNAVKRCGEGVAFGGCDFEDVAAAFTDENGGQVAGDERFYARVVLEDVLHTFVGVEFAGTRLLACTGGVGVGLGSGLCRFSNFLRSHILLELFPKGEHAGGVGRRHRCSLHHSPMVVAIATGDLRHEVGGVEFIVGCV